MFSFAFLIGIYSFIIFGLGITGNLYTNNVIILTILLSVSLFYLVLKSVNLTNTKNGIKNLVKTRELKLVITLIIFQVIVNLIGVFGPEISFDALWYHLTLPKLFIERHMIYHIPGNLLYYSDFPKIGELFYIPTLIFSNEITAKFIHFSFGILCCFVIFKISRKYLSNFYSLLAVLIFYSNLIVGWQSVTAYVDLIRTFFEIMAFWGFLEWIESKKTSWLIEAALMVGLAISVKLTGFLSLLIYLILIVILKYKGGLKPILKYCVIFTLLAILVPSPFFIFSYMNTGNPVYPLFTNLLKFNYIGFSSPVNFIRESLTLLLHSQDPISPIYVIFIPIAVVLYKKFNKITKIFFIYSLIAFLLVILLPIGDKSRFFMPYLTVLSIGICFAIAAFKEKKLKIFMIAVIFLLSVVSFGYRFVANYKFVPYVFGKETKDQFLTKHLNFMFGDFYDTDGYFHKHIFRNDTVLLFGFHNLYYVDFPFIDSSWIKKGDQFNYIAVQNGELPERFKFWQLVYSNSINHVNLYSLGGVKWVY